MKVQVLISDAEPTEADATALDMLLDEMAVRVVADIQRKKGTGIETCGKVETTK